MKDGIRYRLEIHGRPGWFTPAVEGVFPATAERSAVEARLERMIRSYYPPEPEDRFSLSQVLRPEPVADTVAKHH